MDEHFTGFIPVPSYYLKVTFLGHVKNRLDTILCR